MQNMLFVIMQKLYLCSYTDIIMSSGGGAFKRMMYEGIAFCGYCFSPPKLFTNSLEFVVSRIFIPFCFF